MIGVARVKIRMPRTTPVVTPVATDVFLNVTAAIVEATGPGEIRCRKITREIKRARTIALLPYVGKPDN